jgi:hypothetical protein
MEKTLFVFDRISTPVHFMGVGDGAMYRRKLLCRNLEIIPDLKDIVQRDTM